MKYYLQEENYLKRQTNQQAVKSFLRTKTKESQRESTWNGDIKGYNSFPSGLATGSGRSYIHNNGSITISHWEGIFDTESKEQLTFKGRDMNKNGKFVVLRTFFTNSKALGWINGLVCILS